MAERERETERKRRCEGTSFQPRLLTSRIADNAICRANCVRTKLICVCTARDVSYDVVSDITQRENSPIVIRGLRSDTHIVIGDRELIK